jgi:hypothetical protein
MMTVTIAVFIAFYAFFRVDRDELGRLKRLRINVPALASSRH